MARQAEHQRAEDLISAYIDQKVTAEEQDFFERHITTCADCRAQLEATRSMVAALKAMPVVKAPRSFVLPREMAKQPKRSIFAWYPALRLATAVAAIAFVVLFASDMLISRSGRGGAALSIPAAAPAPAMEKAAAPMATLAPAVSNYAASVPQAAQPAPTEVAASGAGNAAAPAPSVAAAPAGASAKVAPTATLATADSATRSMVLPTTTSGMTATPAVEVALAPTGEATPEPQADTQSTSLAAPVVEQLAAAQPVAATPVAPTIDPLRAIEIALLVLAVVLGVATFIARRKQI